MTKIEELAKDYAAYQTGEKGYGSMEAWKQDVAKYHDDAKDVLTWLFSKPLSDRLTDEEKRLVRYAYKMSRDSIKDTSDLGNVVFKSQCELLESIFGAEFFKEEL